MSTASIHPEDPIMRRRLAFLATFVAGAAALTLWLAAASLVSAGDPCYHGFDLPTSTTSTGTQVKVLPCAFSPTVTNVDVGATVTFVNGPDFVHLLAGANQAWGSRDVELSPGRTVSYEFDEPGVYPYACALHRGMSGVIVVGDAATAMAAGARTAAGGASGTTGDASSGGATTTSGSTTAPATTPPSPSASTTEIAALAAFSALAGGLIGATVAWFALRRRANDGKEPAPGVA